MKTLRVDGNRHYRPRTRSAAAPTPALADHNVAIAQRGSIFEIVIEHAAGFEPSERQFELLADHLRSHADAETNVLFEVTPVILRPRVAA